MCARAWSRRALRSGRRGACPLAPWPRRHNSWRLAGHRPSSSLGGATPCSCSQPTCLLGTRPARTGSSPLSCNPCMQQARMPPYCGGAIGTSVRTTLSTASRARASSSRTLQASPAKLGGSLPPAPAWPMSFGACTRRGAPSRISRGVRPLGGSLPHGLTASTRVLTCCRTCTTALSSQVPARPITVWWSCTCRLRCQHAAARACAGGRTTGR